nr:hypothetical protein [uncultured Chryseobacterium sp.]
MKNLRKLKKSELKNVKGGAPTRAYCYQHRTEFFEALSDDFCYHEENATHIACECKRLYGL